LKKIKTAIFISGRGSNMNALIEKSRNKIFPASIDLILSNNSKAEGLLLENANNIKSYFFNKNKFEILAQKILL
jgi:phosphoribosylglycinamide formyltransferase-1